MSFSLGLGLRIDQRKIGATLSATITLSALSITDGDPSASLSFVTDSDGTVTWFFDQTASYGSYAEAAAAVSSADYSGTIVVDADTINASIDRTSFTPGAYYVHIIQTDGAGGFSNVLTDTVTLVALGPDPDTFLLPSETAAVTTFATAPSSITDTTITFTAAGGVAEKYSWDISAKTDPLNASFTVATSDGAGTASFEVRSGTSAGLLPATSVTHTPASTTATTATYDIAIDSGHLYFGIFVANTSAARDYIVTSWLVETV